MGVPEYLLASHPGGQLVAEQCVKTPVLDPTAQQFPATQQMHYKVHYTQSKPVALIEITLLSKMKGTKVLTLSAVGVYIRPSSRT